MRREEELLEILEGIKSAIDSLTDEISNRLPQRKGKYDLTRGEK